MPDIRCVVRFGARELSRPFRVLLGSTVTVRLEFLDAITSAPVAVTGPSVTATRPTGAATTYAEAQLSSAGVGAWTLDVLADVLGTWSVVGACSGPQPETGQGLLAVVATAETQPAPSNVYVSLPGGGGGSVAWSNVSGRPTTLSGYGITDGQPIDLDLTALAALTGTGLARRTAENTWTLDASTYLTANPTITLSGDATGSGTTSITVTLTTVPVAKGGTGSTTPADARTALGAAASGLATGSGITLNTARILGRTTVAVGAIEEISIGSGLSLAAGSLTAAITSVAGRTGAVTLAVADVSGAAASGAIGSSGLTTTTATLLGRSTAGTGTIEQITIGSGLSLAGGTLTATGGGSITMASARMLGRTSAGSGPAEEITVGSGLSLSGGQIAAQAPRVNAAASNPSVTDDSAAGYSPGSVWLNTTSGQAWLCRSASVGAAAWLPLAVQNFPGYVPNRWYTSDRFINWTGSRIVTGSTAANVSLIYALPIEIKTRVTISHLGTVVGIPVTGVNVQLALAVNNPATGEPGARVAITAKSTGGEMGLAANTNVALAISGGSIAIEPGMYWGLSIFDGSAYPVTNDWSYHLQLQLGGANLASMANLTGSSLLALRAQGDWATGIPTGGLTWQRIGGYPGAPIVGFLVA
jgi:hypothetical protein